MPQPVTTPHGPARELIGRLRQCAVEAKRLGDENERLHRDLDEEREHYHRARSEEEAATSTLADWTTLLEDFRSGIRDADELLERTVGRR